MNRKDNKILYIMREDWNLISKFVIHIKKKKKKNQKLVGLSGAPWGRGRALLVNFNIFYDDRNTSSTALI